MNKINDRLFSNNLNINNNQNYSKNKSNVLLIENILNEMVPLFYETKEILKTDEIFKLISLIHKIMIIYEKGKLTKIYSNKKNSNNQSIINENIIIPKFEHNEYLIKAYLSCSQSDKLQGCDNSDHKLSNKTSLIQENNNNDNNIIYKYKNINITSNYDVLNNSLTSSCVETSKIFNNSNSRNNTKTSKLIFSNQFRINKMSWEIIRSFLILICEDLNYMYSIGERYLFYNKFKSYKKDNNLNNNSNIKILNRLLKIQKVIFIEYKQYDYKLLNIVLNIILLKFCPFINEILIDRSTITRIDQIDIMLKNGIILYFLSNLNINNLTINNKIEFLNENIHSRIFHNYLISNKKLNTNSTHFNKLNNAEYTSDSLTDNELNKEKLKYNYKHENKVLSKKSYNINNNCNNCINDNLETDIFEQELTIDMINFTNISIFNLIRYEFNCINSLSLRNIILDKNIFLESIISFLNNNVLIKELCIDKFTVIPQYFKDILFNLLKYKLIYINKLKIVILNSDLTDLQNLFSIFYINKNIQEIYYKFERHCINIQSLIDIINNNNIAVKIEKNSDMLSCNTITNNNIKNISLKFEKISIYNVQDTSYRNNTLLIKDIDNIEKLFVANSINSFTIGNVSYDIMFSILICINGLMCSNIDINNIASYEQLNNKKKPISNKFINLKIIKISLIELNYMDFDNYNNIYKLLIYLIKESIYLKELIINNFTIKYSLSTEKDIELIMNENKHLNNLILKCKQPCFAQTFNGYYYYEYPYFKSQCILFSLKYNKYTSKKIYKNKVILKSMLDYFRYKKQKDIKVFFKT